VSHSGLVFFFVRPKFGPQIYSIILNMKKDRIKKKFFSSHLLFQYGIKEAFKLRLFSDKGVGNILVRYWKIKEN
jgi:hypothetical protein